jgi:hypothetical protein
MKIDRNAAGAARADRLILANGTLNYGGTLVVSNAGAALVGGEAFTNFVAPAYAGAFAATKLPVLNPGLNWYVGDLGLNGSIKVNRSPVASLLSVTNTPVFQVEIPIASLSANATDPDGDAITLADIDLATTNGVTLVTNGSFILYSNIVNVADRFNYTISDGHGGSATGTVVIAPSAFAQFTGQPTADANSVTLHFSGGPGSTYYVERSLDLLGWLTISTNVMPQSGVLDFTDDFSDLTQPPSAAFYRLSWAP